VKPQRFYNIELLKTDEERAQYTSIQLKNYYDILSGGIKFQDNFSSRVFSATFTATSTDTTFSHGLGFIPLGYLRIDSTTAMVIYNGSSGVGAWTSSNITLRSDAIGVATLLVF